MGNAGGRQFSVCAVIFNLSMAKALERLDRGRADDQKEILEKRFSEYRKTKEAIEFFAKRLDLSRQLMIEASLAKEEVRSAITRFVHAKLS